MSSRSDVSFLERCGLTFEKLAANATGARDSNNTESISIRMLNDVKISRRDRPSVPTATGRLELVRVELRAALLTIATIKGERTRGASCNTVETVSARLYAVKTVAMQGAAVFMFLAEPPSGVTDDKFLSAEGTAVLYDNDHRWPRMLKACGADRSDGQSLSWIFHAVET